MKTDAKMEGTDELIKKFIALGKSLDGKELTAVMRNAAAPMLGAARGRVPSDSGLLRSQIGFVGANQSRYPGTVIIGVNYRFKGAKRGTSAFYAHIVEYGGKTISRAPRPFMQPAFEIHKDRAVDTIKKGLIRLITKATNNTKK